MAKQIKGRRLALRASLRPYLALWLVGYNSTHKLTHHTTSGRLGRWDRATMRPIRPIRPLRGRLLYWEPAAITPHSLYWRVAYARQQRANSRDIIGTPPSRHNMEGKHGTSCRSPLPDSLRKDSTVHLPLSTSSSHLSTSRLTEDGEYDTTWKESTVHLSALHFPTHWGRRALTHTRCTNTLWLKNILTVYTWMLCNPF
jgi:hypothetical protein